VIKVSWDNGILVETKDLKLILDPSNRIGSADCAFISHAHRDHTGALIDVRKPKYSTRETIAIFEAITLKKVRNAVPCVYDEPMKLHQTELKIINSGHVFGSGALLLKEDNVTFFYTGDFNFTDTLTQKAIAPHDCDILVLETTYGTPAYMFPAREEIYDSIVHWAAKTIMEDKIPFILVYPLGKAQEITRLFNLYTSIPVVTHPSITRTNSEVNSFGGDLVFYDLAKEGEELLRSKSCVCLFPTSYSSSALRMVYPNSKTCTVTGWALTFGRRNVDESFVLSSHADYEQLMSFTKACRPKKVYTVHGYAAQFAEKLRINGIDAMPLDQTRSQRTKYGRQ
jgi:Cft2 family RNA processing exonuclease